MDYELIDFSIRGMSLDDALKELHVTVNITVGIVGCPYAIFKVVNPNIDFAVKGFTSYDQLSADVKDKSTQWVIDTYPST